MNAELLTQLKQTEPGLVVLFGGKNCGVCQSICPQLEAMIATHFPKLKWIYLDCHQAPELCAQQGVFSLPVLQVYFEGQKHFEAVRVFSLKKVQADLTKPYALMFGDELS